MKKMVESILRCFAFATLLLGAGALSANTETVDGISWTYTVVDGKASIGLPLGKCVFDAYECVAISRSTTGAITIPATLGGFPVTSIGEYAFCECTGLTSVAIPDTVASIGEGAFAGCTGLTSVPVGNSVKNIGEYVFYGCTELASVIIPDAVTSIGRQAFGGCNGLTSVDIPNSVTNIGLSAFGGCSALTNVTIGCDVTIIGEGAFLGCTGLADTNGFVVVCGCLCYYCGEAGDVSIPDSVTIIGYDAFADLEELTSVTIPDSVTNIYYYAFEWCTGLTNVTIGASVTSLNFSVFDGCVGLTSFHVAEGNPKYKSVNGLLLTKDGTSLVIGVNGDVAIPDSVTSVGTSAFAYLEGLTSVTIPNSVTNIGSYAFVDCTGLTSVTMPVSVKHIEMAAFEGCSGLTSVTIPDSVTTVEDWTFAHCVGLTSMTIPDGVMSIGERAFYGCGGLTSVTIPNSVTNIGDCAFDSCRGLLSFHVEEGNQQYKSVNGLLLTNDGTILVFGVNGDVVIPDSVTSIGDNAFNNYRGLTSVAIPDSVTSIGKDAFSWCVGLTSVTIPNSVTNIGSSAFSSCRGLTDIIIPSSVTSIGEGAFYGCSGLTSVTIPSSVTSIGNRAFFDCSGLTSVTMRGRAPSLGGGDVFNSYVAMERIVYLPRAASGYAVDGNGKWYGMTVEYYGIGTDDNGIVEAVGNGEYVVTAIKGKTLTTADIEMTAIVGGLKVNTTAGYNIVISEDGQSATVALMSPFKVGSGNVGEDAVATPLWTENGEGNVTLNVKVVPGLYYAAASAASLETLKCPGADLPATAETTLIVAKPESETQGFFKVWVGDAPIASEE